MNNNIAYLYTGKRYQNCLIDNVVQDGKFIRGILPTKRGKLKKVVFSTKSRNVELVIVPRYYF